MACVRLEDGVVRSRLASRGGHRFFVGAHVPWLYSPGYILLVPRKGAGPVFVAQLPVVFSGDHAA